MHPDRWLLVTGFTTMGLMLLGMAYQVYLTVGILERIVLLIQQTH